MPAFVLGGDCLVVTLDAAATPVTEACSAFFGSSDSDASETISFSSTFAISS